MPTLASQCRPPLGRSVTSLLMTLSSHASGWLWCWVTLRVVNQWSLSGLLWQLHGLWGSLCSQPLCSDFGWASYVVLSLQSWLWVLSLTDVCLATSCSYGNSLGDPGNVVIGSVLSVMVSAWSDVRLVWKIGCCGVTYCGHNPDFPPILNITVD